MTPLTPQITTKASGDRQRTSVYLRKPAPLRQLQHTHTHTHTHRCKRYRQDIHTQRHKYTEALKPTPHSEYCISTSTRGKYSSNPPGRLMAHTLTHDNALIFIFFPPPLPPGSAGCADGAVWRNPLSRHFSFPLTDRPWRARAFGPPAWLAARQLNKPSSCYNSLKHFQLPESNKSCRRALGRFSTSNPTPQRVLLRLSFGLSEDPPCYIEGEEFFFFSGQSKHKVCEGNWRVQTAGHWEEGDDF